MIAVDTRTQALDLALKNGADLAVPSNESSAASIRDATGGRGADVILDFVGSDTTLAMAAAAARTVGDVTIVGIGGGTLPLSFFSVLYEVSLRRPTGAPGPNSSRSSTWPHAGSCDPTPSSPPGPGDGRLPADGGRKAHRTGSDRPLATHE